MKRYVSCLPAALAVLLVSLSFALPSAAPAWAEEAALSKANAAFARGDYAEAARLYWPLAEAGDAEAQAQLGAMYRDGLGLPQDDDQALIWSLYAALQNNPTAHYSLGVLYRRGRGLTLEGAIDQSTKLLRRAAAQGQPDALIRLAEIAAKSRDGEAEALYWYRQAAEIGHAEAQYRLAELVEDAEGVSREEAKAEAFRWIRAAAEQGHPKALYELAKHYRDGRQVQQDTAEALRLYHRAAEEGNAFASHVLASSYREGQHVEKDLATAAMWHHIGVAQDAVVDRPHFKVKWIEQEMSAAEIAEAENRAQDWLAAHPRSLRVSRWDRARLRTARPAPGDPLDERALAAMRLAAELGDPNAQFNLGRMHYTGNGLPQDDVVARRWLSPAAEQGQPRAQTFLGILYIKGRSVAQDMVTGQMWLTIAAAQGDLLGRQVSENNAKEMSEAQVAEAEKRAKDWLAAFEARLAARLASYRARGSQSVQAAAVPALKPPPNPAEERAAALRQAAEAGDAKAQARLAMFYLEGLGVKPDLAEAVRWTRAAAEQGHARSQVYLASSLIDGMGVAKDEKAALLWLQKAIDQNLPLAQSYLGDLYEAGKGGLAQDDAAAAKWYRLAAEQNFGWAQSKLGQMYLEGRGIAQDHFAAHVWLNLGGRWDLLEEAARGLSRDQITEAQARARALFEGFEARQDWRQVKTIGEAAEAVGKHPIEARYDGRFEDPVLQTLKRNAEAGDPEAQAELALRFHSGRGIPKSLEQAVYWYRLAAAQGHAPSMHRLSGMFYSGAGGVEKNKRIAARWRLRAAQRGVKGAFYWTAGGYRQGDTLPKDYILAHVWYSLAIDEGNESAESLRRWLVREMTPAEIAEAEERAEAWRKKFANDQDAAD